MNYQLVIQFPLTDASADDFDRLLMIENKLDLALRDKHQVDGHDIGAGKINIFIHTNNPVEAFELAKSTLSDNDMKTISVAFKDIDGDIYSVVWPENHNDVFTIK